MSNSVFFSGWVSGGRVSQHEHECCLLDLPLRVLIRGPITPFRRNRYCDTVGGEAAPTPL